MKIKTMSEIRRYLFLIDNKILWKGIVCTQEQVEKMVPRFLECVPKNKRNKESMSIIFDDGISREMYENGNNYYDPSRSSFAHHR
jgi:hypothetical protein